MSEDEEIEQNKISIWKILGGMVKGLGTGATRAVGFISPVFYKVAHPKISKIGKQVINKYSKELEGYLIEDFAKKHGITNKKAEYILSIAGCDIELAELITEIVSSKLIDVRPTINPYYETRVSLDGFCSLMENPKIKEMTVEEKKELLKDVRDIAVLGDTVENIFYVFEGINYDKEKIEMVRELKGCTGESIKKIYKVLMSEDIRWDKEIVKQIIGISGEKGIYDSKHILKQLKMNQYNSENTLDDWENPLNIKGKIKFVWTMTKLGLGIFGAFSGYKILTTPKSQPKVTPSHIEADAEKIKDGKVSLEDGGLFVESTEVPIDSEVWAVGDDVTIVYGDGEVIHTTISKLEAAGLKVVANKIDAEVYTDGQYYGASTLNVRNDKGEIIGEVVVATDVIVDTRKTSYSILDNHAYYYVEGKSNESNEGYVIDYAVQLGDNICIEGDNYLLKLKEGAHYRSSPDSRSDDNILDLDREKPIAVGTPKVGPDGNIYFKTYNHKTDNFGYVPAYDIESIKTVANGKDVDFKKIKDGLRSELEKAQKPEIISTNTSSMNEADIFRSQIKTPGNNSEIEKKAQCIVEEVNSEVQPEVVGIEQGE